MIITENCLGAPDTLTPDGKVHDDYRIDYIHQHIQSCALVILDGADLIVYSPGSFMASFM